jgi:hypothetical protein
MLCKLFAEVRFTGAWLSRETGLEWLETSFFAEFLFHKLNVGRNTCFTVPWKVVFPCWFTAFFFWSFVGNK